ncbi:hypothetical protein A5886_002635 [Enterococcus sp. 8G7_MSG3316]|uniref:WxL domain-containing protein n=1 Tax=Candidatus Enterococcus testudinis TaxID=1834191 RepID=A0A242A925_9ENTE|nr:WxL domain-containing protein [Enterococcus sp. 8G7_MSG3316]OTN77535.1 hypothetical protein A5886_002635 [Enterococcus sp. 8G7_MSG3316]
MGLKRKVSLLSVLLICFQALSSPLYIVRAETFAHIDYVETTRDDIQQDDEIAETENAAENPPQSTEDSEKQEDQETIEDQEERQDENEPKEGDMHMNVPPNGSEESSQRSIAPLNVTTVTSESDFRNAMNNSSVGVISLGANVTVSTGVNFVLNRDLVIQGNGHTLSLSNNSIFFGLQLRSNTQPATLRLENIGLSKIGSTPFFKALDNNDLGTGWTVELEDVYELSTSRAAVILAREAKIHFTGGQNTFDTRISSTDTLFNVKDVLISNQANLTIAKQNLWIFYSAPTVSQPSVQLSGNATVDVTTTAGDANVIDYRGPNPLVQIEEGSRFNIDTIGTAPVATVNSNNVITLNGNNPRLLLSGDSQLQIDTTLNKRPINLEGTNPTVQLDQSRILIKSETQTGVNLVGNQPSFAMTNDSRLSINAQSGSGVVLAGNQPKMDLLDSEITIENQIAASALVVDGLEARLTLDNSQLSISNAGTGVIDNIQIGQNKDFPQLRLSNQSTISIDTASGTAAPTATANNGLSLRGREAKMIVDQESALQFQVRSGVRRGLYINGASAELLVDNQSTISSRNLYGTSIELETSNGQFTVDRGSEVTVEGSSNRARGLIIFRNGNNRLTVRNDGKLATKHVEFDRLGSNTNAVAMHGSENRIRVTNGGALDLNNTHYSVKPADGTVDERYATLYLGTGNNYFVIDNEAGVQSNSLSRLVLINDYAAAMLSDGGHLTFEQQKDTIFIAEGSSSGDKEFGVFVAGDTMSFNVTEPFYYDFRNIRRGGGDIFGTKDGSELLLNDTFFSAWKSGRNFDHDADVMFSSKINVNYEGRDFVTATSKNDPELTRLLPSLTGTVSRISANNAQPISQGYRQPTNADKSFIAEFGFKEGDHSIREAGTGEVTAEILVTFPNGQTETHRLSTQGAESAYQTWEEAEQNITGKAGRIKLTLPSLFEVGTTFEFLSVQRGEGSTAISIPDEELAAIGKIEVLPIRPPALADFGQSLTIFTTDRSVRALPNSINQAGNRVNLYLNQTYIQHTLVESDGSFALSLPEQLAENDVLQFVMEDHSGAVIDTYSTIDNTFRRPATNTDIGNRNPLTEDYVYHDTVFPKAVSYIVKQPTHVGPVDPLDPGESVTPEDLPDRPADQGLLSIDFVSNFNFGVQRIATQTAQYYARPQRIIEDDGRLEERPNYVQVSDRRGEDKGWQLAVTQAGAFESVSGHTLQGAQINLTNQELASIDTSADPTFNYATTVGLIPGYKHLVLSADDAQGKGTWVYRFGDETSADQSIFLEVPGGANPQAVAYKTTLDWQLQSVPGN